MKTWALILIVGVAALVPMTAWARGHHGHSWGGARHHHAGSQYQQYAIRGVQRVSWSEPAWQLGYTDLRATQPER
jgi:hypothetical protein